VRRDAFRLRQRRGLLCPHDLPERCLKSPGSRATRPTSILCPRATTMRTLIPPLRLDAGHGVLAKGRDQWSRSRHRVPTSRIRLPSCPRVVESPAGTPDPADLRGGGSRRSETASTRRRSSPRGPGGWRDPHRREGVRDAHAGTIVSRARAPAREAPHARHPSPAPIPRAHRRAAPRPRGGSPLPPRPS
jgi:hypothetical protein